ncbi:MAG: hypothetical protein ACRES3_08555 [Steroidobacteraceae bacterium]
MFNSRHNVSKPASIARLTVVAAAIVSGPIVSGQWALAAAVPETYEMAAIEDQAHGRIVTAGQYSEAISRLNRLAGHRRHSFAAKTNLCVAYTVTMAFDEARSACDEAVRVRDVDAKTVSRYSPMDDRVSARDTAIAYSNRGVLRAVTGDEAGARADFETAAELHTGLRAPTANLLRLTAKETPSLSAL